MIELSKLIEGLNYKASFDTQNVFVTDINCDTRIKPSEGYLFLAIDGIDSDGHKYIQKAIESGASVIAGTKSLDILVKEYSLNNDIKYIQLIDENPRIVWAKLSDRYFDYKPEEHKIIAVTGTDGKTTTTNLTYQILLQSGKKVGLFSTIGLFFNGEKLDSTAMHNTTPDSYMIHKYLKYFKEHGADYGVMEVSSFAYLQNRIYGLQFESAAITNLTHEHLEQHKTYENYAMCKAGILSQAKNKFYNRSEIQHNMEVFDKVENIKEWSTQIIQKYNLNLDNFSKTFNGDYNVKNLSVSLTLLESLDEPNIFNDIQKKVDNLKTVIGRFDKIQNNLGLNIYVDYAHTPNGMEALLSGVKNLINEDNKIHCIFGCEGRRDEGKREPMGEVVKKYCDISYLSPVDPRDTDVNIINDQIEKGWNKIQNDHKLLRFTDRKEAIESAIKNAKEGDWVLLLGKGDETTMDMGDGPKPYSDYEVVKKILEALN